MKKRILLTMGAAFAVTAAMAQAPAKVSHPVGIPLNNIVKKGSPNKATNQYYIDLAESEVATSTFPNLETSIQYLQSNSDSTRYNKGGRGFYGAIAKFDTLVLTEDFANYTYGNYSNVTKLTLDTVSFMAGFKKFSAASVTDSIKISVLPMNNQGYPITTTSSVIWDTIIELNDNLPSQNATAPAGSFYGGGFNIATGGIEIPGNKKFAIEVRYMGNSMDTLVLWTAWPTDEVPCATSSGVQPYGDILEGSFYPAAFYSLPLGNVLPQGGGPNDTIFFAESILFPRPMNDATNPGGFVWALVCNGKSTSISTDPDDFNNPAVNPTQYYNVWTAVTLEHNISVQDMDAKSIAVTNYPNPAADFTTVEFSTVNEGNATLKVTDLTGKQIANYNLGKVVNGVNKFDLNTSNYSAGVYVYTLNVDGIQVTKKFVVTK